MSYATQSFDTLKRQARTNDDLNTSFLDNIGGFLEDMLLDPDFDKIGVLDAASDDFNMYRDLGALPGQYR